MATIYELTEQANALYNLLQAEEIDEQTYNDTLEAMGAGEKVESYCKVIKQLQSDAEMYKTEIDRLTAPPRQNSPHRPRMIRRAHGTLATKNYRFKGIKNENMLQRNKF